MTKVQIVSLVAAVVLLGVVLELVRQRRLQERYSLLWLLTGGVIFVLAAWRSGLAEIASAMGIFYPPSALFVLASGFFLLLLLHYSTVISRLSEQNTRLAQRVALLEERIRSTGADSD
jgi:hypothetical protein